MCINEKYRTRLLQLYKRCLLTGYDAVQCDAAHIIPQYICYRFSLLDLVDDIYNGLILTKDLHITFDKHIWTFDIYDVRWESPIAEWCSLPIIVSNTFTKRSLAINQFENQLIRVPVRSLPFLWINYNVFMMVNYQGGQIREKYQELLGSEEYTKLLTNPYVLSNLTNWLLKLTYEQNVGMVINKRNFGFEYQVIYQCSPWSQRTWLQAEKIPNHLIELYENYIDENDDPDWRFNGSPPKKFTGSPPKKKPR